MSRILRKVKEGFKKKFSKLLNKKHAKVVRESKSGKSGADARSYPMGTAVEGSRFYTPGQGAVQREQYPIHSDLPLGYAEDRIVLQVRDPWWIHAYWEVTKATWERLRQEFSIIASGGFKRVLRVYDVSHIIFNGDNAHRFFDIEVRPESNNWYIDTQGPGRSWCVDSGLLFENGRFLTLVRSNTVSTPLAGPSWIIDEEWMIPEDIFSRLYGLGVGMGSSPLKLKKLWEERSKREFGSAALSSLASPVKKKEQLQGLWLQVNTELIVYGQTQPRAKLTIGGQLAELKPDGSFSLRFFLPDGKQVIPVVATSSDGEQVRSITPIVTKETK